MLNSYGIAMVWYLNFYILGMSGDECLLFVPLNSSDLS